MRVVDLIKSTDNTAFSFEILPPLKGTGIEKLYKTVDTLREFDPKYINITTHRSEYVYKELGNGCTNVHASAAVPEQLLLPPLCRTNTI